MKKMTYLVMALAMVLGFTQCKKEQAPANNQTEGVFITLNVNGGASTGSAADGSRVEVTPGYTNPTTGQTYAKVEYEEGDVIYVGYKNAYVGSLTYSGGTFSGSVDISESDYGEKLHFYFLGGVGFTPTVDGNTATVVISDQSSRYPVISYSPSKESFAGEGSYSAKLQNKVSIMKFNVTTRSAAPICITGMNNKVTLNFNPETEGTDEGFTYGINTEDGGLIKMPAKDANNETWAIVLPQDDLAASETNGSANSFDHPYYYSSTRPAIHKIESNKYYHENNDVIAMTMNSRVVDLSKLTAHYTAQDGDTLSGILDGESQPYKINVNTDGASITLLDATINGKNDEKLCSWAGITCDDNTTLVIEGTNNVTGFYENYPGISIAFGKTLTIEGNGTLNASCNGGADGWGAGIGCNDGEDCGNIVIRSGNITATGGIWMAGIGCGFGLNCGYITINGGTVTANGGVGAAGIGTGYTETNISCGNITINGGNVTATGGKGAAGIGSGFVTRSSHNTCGSISINGGQVTATGGDGGDVASDIIIGVVYWSGYAYYGGAGIGTGSTVISGAAGYSDCGTINIGSGVISVTATKGSGTHPADNSIGCSSTAQPNHGSCGIITIGGTTSGNISDSPYIYQP